MYRVICAWGGTGKTSLAKTDKRFIDLKNSDYQWIYEDDIKDPELRKGAKHKPNPDFPENYIEAIKTAILQGKYVLCGTRPDVLDTLRQHGIDFIILHPSLDEKSAYQKRYMARGNTAKWAHDCVNTWNARFVELHQKGYETLQMRKDSYISDYMDEMSTYLTTPLCLLRRVYHNEWIEFNSPITDFLNTLLHEDSKDYIREHGRRYGTYILWDGEYYIRIPGCTLGGIIVDSKNSITRFHINAGFPFRCLNMETPQELEYMLLSMFGGSILTKPGILNKAI